MKRDIVIAIYQFPVSGKIEKNLAFILKLMTQANHKGAEIVHFCESSLLKESLNDIQSG
jgi:predicted amidohydrolase